MNSRVISRIVCLIAICGVSYSAETLSAKKFADKNGILNKHATLSYLVFRDKVPASAFLKPGEFSAPDSRVEEAVGDTLNDLTTQIGHGPPFRWQDIDKVSPPKLSKADAEAAAPGWQKIEYLTKKKEIKENDVLVGSIGPLRLRKDSTQAGKPLDEATGAKIGYADNRLVKGNGAWNSQGALLYPITREWDGRDSSGRSNGSYFLFETTPAISWQLAETEDRLPAKDVQDLKFSVPITLSYAPPAQRRQGRFDESAHHARRDVNLVAQVEPYFDTDFGFRHEIWGVTASLEYVGPVGPFYLGGFTGLINTKPESTNIGSLLMCRVRVRPLLDYSATERGGPHTSRSEGDDWFRLGGEASFDLRFGGKKNPLDVGISYRFMYTESGDSDFAELLKYHATLWLSPNVGLTAEYQRGDTSVSDKKIDLVTLGLELKY